MQFKCMAGFICTAINVAQHLFLPHPTPSNTVRVQLFADVLQNMKLKDSNTAHVSKTKSSRGPVSLHFYFFLSQSGIGQLHVVLYLKLYNVGEPHFVLYLKQYSTVLLHNCNWCSIVPTYSFLLHILNFEKIRTRRWSAPSKCRNDFRTHWRCALSWWTTGTSIAVPAVTRVIQHFIFPYLDGK